jgi:transcription antitermination protein NusB
MGKVSIAARRQARYMLVQALYQWQLTQAGLIDINEQFRTKPQYAKADQAYFHEVLAAVVAQASTIDALFMSFLDRPIEGLDPIELSILRLATYELAHHLELPYRVVINEALELSKIFGATDSYKYVNGVLDQVAKQLRQVERQKDSQ